MSILLEIVFFTVLISLVLAVITRFLTNPKKIKEVKTEMEFYKGKISEYQKAANKDEVKRYTDLMMGTSKKQFQLSMKSLIATMIVVMVALGYIHQTYEGLTVDLSKETKAVFRSDSYDLKADNQTFSIDLDKNGFTDSDSHKYGDIIQFSDATWKVDKIDNKLHFSLFAAKTPFIFPVLGGYLNWFWLYFLLSIPTSLLFRKLLGVES